MSVINYRSLNFFLFLFVTSIFVSVCLADISKDISGNFTEELPGDAENDIDDEARARKALRVKDTVIDLCQNLPGCTCDGKHERANCSCNINDEHKLKRIAFDQVKIPLTIVKLNIFDCPFVEIAQTKLTDLPIKSLNILRVNRLVIGPGSLKRVDRLNLENINKLEYVKDALTELVADTMTLINVTLPVGSELAPQSIKSELKIVQCNLTDFTIIVDTPQTDLSVSIHHSYLYRLSLKINAGTFTMDGNQFVQLSSKSAGLMDVMYSQSLNMKNNRFGMDNAISILPDVMSSNQSLIFHATYIFVESKEWLEHFKLEFTGTNQTSVTGRTLDSSRGSRILTQNSNVSSCDVQNAPDSTNSRVLICPNVKSLVEFLKTETKVTTPNSHQHQPEKQKQVQTHDDVKALGISAIHHCPALVLVITSAVQVRAMLLTFV